VLVLRNNDLGDLLIVTPIFAALKEAFPGARVIAGIGKWNRDVLANNPHVDEVVTLNAPWHNKFVSPQGLKAALRYLFSSAEVTELRSRNIDAAIDVLGSQFGSLLFLRAGIPIRIGVKGYAEGSSVATRYLQYDENLHVGRAALNQVELLSGKPVTTDNRPQLFLNKAEEEFGANFWQTSGAANGAIKVVIGPGAGFEEKCWPATHFAELSRRLKLSGKAKVVVLGGPGDREKCELVAGKDGVNGCGSTTLRQTFAIVRHADLVLCNSSMMMHAAAAFKVPCLVLLGGTYSSAQQHAQQWGSSSTEVLGKEPGLRRDIYNPAEVAACIARKFSDLCGIAN
jgi:heptosyltransferase-2